MSERGAHSGLALAVIVIGVLMASADTTIVVLALPEMERALHAPVAQLIWVVITYLLVITLLATQVGRLGDMYGRVRMYEAGFLVFISGSALCGIASNMPALIGFRILQGVGGALITANSGAVIADTFPPASRGRAYGYHSAGWSTGAVLGVLLGGVITTYLTWRWVFWVNVPGGLIAFAIAIRVLRDSGGRAPKRLDWPGMVTLGAGLFGVLWAMTQLVTSDFTGPVLGYLVTGAGLLVAFIFIERASPAPMVDPSIFRIPTMTPTLLAAMLQYVANFSVLFLVIMYLQGVRQLNPLGASLLLIPGYLVGGAVGPMAGRLADRIGVVWPATFGLAVEIVALGIYAGLGATVPLWVVTVASVVNGLGSEFFFPANNSAVMKVAPGSAFGTASGLLRTVGNVGMVFSFTVAILVAARSIPRDLAVDIFAGTARLSPQMATAFTAGLHSAFYTSMAFMAGAAALSASRVLSLRRSP